MQDHAAVAAFHLEHHINTIKLPAYSPDLNRIKYLWWVLKRACLSTIHGTTTTVSLQRSGNGFCEAPKECWRSIPEKLLLPNTPARSATAAIKVNLARMTAGTDAATI
jgi:hypothetical protein